MSYIFPIIAIGVLGAGIVCLPGLLTAGIISLPGLLTAGIIRHLDYCSVMNQIFL